MSWLTDSDRPSADRQPAVDAPLRGRLHARPRRPTIARASTPSSSKFNKIIDGVVAAEILEIPRSVRPCATYADAFELARVGPRNREPRRRHRFRLRVPDPQRRRQCRAFERAARAWRARRCTHSRRTRAISSSTSAWPPSIAGARVQLVDRPHHHPAARRASAQRDEAARRRRHLGAHPGDPRRRTSSARWRAP